MQKVREARQSKSCWLSIGMASGFSPAWAGAISVVILVVAASYLYKDDLFQPVEQDKGLVIPSPRTDLGFAIGFRQPNGELTVERGIRGERYSDATHLYLQFKNPEDSHVYLMMVHKGSIDLLYPREPIQIGRDTIDFTFEGLEGRFVVVAAASSKSLDPLNQLVPLIQESVDESTGAVDWRVLANSPLDITLDTIYFDVTR